MRPGGGHSKGASFERETGLALSLWLSDGQRKDLFRRNILSGGRFTMAAAKGEIHGVPGDLAADLAAAGHPMAFAFATTFLVECKHYASLDWEAFLYTAKGKSFLHGVIDLCRKQGSHAGLHWMVIAKQNRRPAMVFMEAEIGFAALDARRDGEFDYHMLHRGSLMLMPFVDLLAHVQPAVFIQQAMEISNGKDDGELACL